MAIEVSGGSHPDNMTDGLKMTRKSFLLDHINTSNQMQAVSLGLDKDDPVPPYDPNSADNQWPKMIYHASLGYKVIGTSLKGLKDSHDSKIRSETEAANKQLLAESTASVTGWRLQPFAKPVVTLKSPEEEKHEFQKKFEERDNIIRTQADQLDQLKELVQKLIASQPLQSQSAGGKK